MKQPRLRGQLILLLVALLLTGGPQLAAVVRAQQDDSGSTGTVTVAPQPAGVAAEGQQQQRQQQQPRSHRFLRRRGGAAAAAANVGGGRGGGVPPVQPPPSPPPEQLAARRWIVVYNPAAVAEATAAAPAASSSSVGAAAEESSSTCAPFVRPAATARLFVEWSLQPDRSVSFPNGLAFDVISNASAARDLTSGFGATSVAAQEVASVQLEGLLSVAARVRTPRFRLAKQSRPPSWGLDRIDQRPTMLNSGYMYPRFVGQSGGGGVDVYVIDTGIRTTHTQFTGGRATMVKTYFPPILADDYGHGTHVAGIIGGAAVGVAKHAQIKGIKVLDRTGYGREGDVIDAVGWVVRQCRGSSRRCIINMSLGAPRLPALNAAIDAAWDAGIISVVAAGNDDQDANNMSPASATRAVTVGASTASDWRAYFSNWGPSVDLFAPGYDIASASWMSDFDYAYLSGTSMAAPHVAGAVANIWTAKPSLTPQQVVDELVAMSTKGILYDVPSTTPNRLLYTPLW